MAKRIYHIKWKKVLYHSIFFWIGLLFPVAVAIIENGEYTLEYFIFSSFLWVFHLYLLLEYYFEDFSKRMIVDNDKLVIIKGKRITQLSLDRNITHITHYKTKDYSRNPFPDFGFIEMELSNGKRLYLTSLSTDTEKAAKLLFRYHRFETKTRFYPSLMIQKIRSKFK